MKIELTPEIVGTPCVRDVMHRGVISVSPHMSVPELAALLTAKMISGAPVVDSAGEVVGVVSLTDIAINSGRGQSALAPGDRKSDYYTNLSLEDEVAQSFYVEDYAQAATVAEIMTPVVYVVRETAPLTDLIELLVSARIHRALVSDGRSVVGIVTTTDLIRIIPRLLELAS